MTTQITRKYAGIIPISVPLPWANAEVDRYRRALGCFKNPDERLMTAVSFLMFGLPADISFFEIAIGATPAFDRLTVSDIRFLSACGIRVGNDIPRKSRLAVTLWQ